MKGKVAFALGLGALLVISAAGTAFAAPVCLNIGGVMYQLRIGFAGDAVIVNGVIHTTPKATFTGTGFADPSGNIIIGWTGDYRGDFPDPIEVTNLRVTSGGLFADQTFFGKSPAPRNFLLTPTIVSCPAGSSPESETPGPSPDDGAPGPNSR